MGDHGRDLFDKIEDTRRDKWKENAELYRLNLQYLMRFYFFFVGLNFAILSFSMQYSITTQNIYIKIIQIVAWFFLLFSGILGLKEIGAFTLTDIEKVQVLNRLKKYERIIMWILFILALELLAIARTIDYFLK